MTSSSLRVARDRPPIGRDSRARLHGSRGRPYASWRVRTAASPSAVASSRARPSPAGSRRTCPRRSSPRATASRTSARSASAWRWAAPSGASWSSGSPASSASCASGSPSSPRCTSWPTASTMTVGELAEEIGRSPSATSRLIDGLVRRRLVERHQEPEDRRQRTLRLTQRGHAVLRVVDRSRADQFLSRGPAAPDGGAGHRGDGRGRARDPRHQPARPD